MGDENEDLDEIEDSKGVRLQRGFSKICNNINLVVSARQHVLQQINEDPIESLSEKSVFTFILPNLHNHPEDFKAFLFKDLIDSSVLVSLEQEGDLNWWTDRGICGRLLPMVTSGDGNCLLHAASLAMWGFHDRVLALRTALHQTLHGGEDMVEAFRRRWYHEKNTSFKASGLQLDNEEWEKEWKVILSLSSPTPRSDSMLTYESLEEIHIFVLCHVIRRPIIVFASPFLKNFQGQNIAPVPFRGIYLPLEIPSEQCCKSPLLLVYNHSHFNALCPVQEDSFQKSSIPPILVPLVDKDLNRLPVHFLVDPGRQSSTKESVRSFLDTYMNIHEVFVNNMDGSMSLKRRRKSSVQSTKYVSTSFEQSGLGGSDSDEVFSDKPLQPPCSILAARLTVVKAPFADEIVGNYMGSVEKSFANLSKIRSKVNIQIKTNSMSSPKNQKSSGKDFNNLNKLKIECDETSEIQPLNKVASSNLHNGLKQKDVNGFDGNQEIRKSKIKTTKKEEKDVKPKGHYLIGYDDHNEGNNNAYSMSLNRNIKVKPQDYVNYDKLYCDYNNNEKKNFLKDYRLVQPNIPSNHQRNDIRFSDSVKEDFSGVSATLQKFFTSGRPKEGKVTESFVHIGNSKFYADITDNGVNHNNKTDDLDDNVLNNEKNYNNNNNNDFNFYEKDFKNGLVEPAFSTFPQRSSTAKHNKKSIFTSAIPSNQKNSPTHVRSKSNLPPSSSSHNLPPSRPPPPQQIIKQQDTLKNAKQTAETKSQSTTLKYTPIETALCSTEGCTFEASIGGMCRICWVEGGHEQNDEAVFQPKAPSSHYHNQTKSYYNTNNVFPSVYTGKNHGAFVRNDKKRIVEKRNSDRSTAINAKDKHLSSDFRNYGKTKL